MQEPVLKTNLNLFWHFLLPHIVFYTWQPLYQSVCVPLNRTHFLQILPSPPIPSPFRKRLSISVSPSLLLFLCTHVHTHSHMCTHTCYTYTTYGWMGGYSVFIMSSYLFFFFSNSTWFMVSIDSQEGNIKNSNADVNPISLLFPDCLVSCGCFG